VVSLGARQRLGMAQHFRHLLPGWFNTPALRKMLCVRRSCPTTLQPAVTKVRSSTPTLTLVVAGWHGCLTSANDSLRQSRGAALGPRTVDNRAVNLGHSRYIDPQVSGGPEGWPGRLEGPKSAHNEEAVCELPARVGYAFG
jgi:hypothetical protein